MIELSEIPAPSTYLPCWAQFEADDEGGVYLGVAYYLAAHLSELARDNIFVFILADEPVPQEVLEQAFSQANLTSTVVHRAVSRTVRIRLSEYSAYLWPHQWPALISRLEEGRPTVGWFNKWRGDSNED